MKFVVACDSFKGCMTSQEVIERIKIGIHKANSDHEVAAFPMCDGGEGTMDVLCHIEKAEMVKAATIDAYGKPIEIEYGIVPQKHLAIQEVASCIGLNMTEKGKRNPMIANSRGVGRMLMDAVERGCHTIILGLGGTSTNDGGMGLLHELGIRFYDRDGHYLRSGIYSLSKVAKIDTRYFTPWDDVKILLAVDVRNHLLGPHGATYTFGRQKGLFPSQLEEIDQAMAHYARCIQHAFHVDINKIEGSGSAGGIGGVLVGILHAKMISGIELCMQESNLEEAIRKCDVVITGEGQSDEQTLYGKVPYGVCKLAKKYDRPVFCLSGALGIGYQELYQCGFDGLYSSADRAMDFLTALRYGPEKIENLAFALTKTIDAIVRMEEQKCDY